MGKAMRCMMLTSFFSVACQGTGRGMAAKRKESDDPQLRQSISRVPIKLMANLNAVTIARSMAPRV